jgi:23S rRNA (guanosine2251-2'-O)-methyltransferase
VKSAKSKRREQAVVFGIHAVGVFLRRTPHLLIRLHVFETRKDERLEEIIRRAAAAGCVPDPVTREQLDRMADGGNHQGVLAIIKPRPAGNEAELGALLDGLDTDPLLLVLDGVQDPQNLGACLRTADAAGVHAVIAPRNRAAGLNATVRKVAAGAAETVPFIQVTNLARAMRGLRDRGVRLVGTAGEAETSIFDMVFEGPLAIVMGGEGRGLRRLTREHCDLLVSLPMAGAVESLNVSVATGICLYHALAGRRPDLAAGGGGE